MSIHFESEEIYRNYSTKMVRNISIIIPARNEADNLPKIIPEILNKYNKHILEIIVLDDCSTDNTSEIATQLQKKYLKVKLIQRNSTPGVGLALREGISHLSPKSEYVLLMDCDFLINIYDIKKMLLKVEDYDGVIGSRFIKKNSLENYPRLKLIANRSYHFLAKTLLGIKHNDLTNNFKLYKISLLKKICPFFKSHDFAINAETGFYPVLMNASIYEIPVKWQERKVHMGLSKFKILKVGPSYTYIFFRLLLMKLGIINIPK